jgi:C4-dicarboxylate-specific signal transduction histidine kinase
MIVAKTSSGSPPPSSPDTDLDELLESHPALRARLEELELRVRQAEERRRALLHIMGDLQKINKRLADQRKAMLHILDDYEKDRSRPGRQTEKLDNSRRALLHLLQDAHQSNLRLAHGRKAMIHIMGDLNETSVEVQHREQELRDKQEQLVQAAKLATLGELTTGVAHELNNPLNNIGLFVGNAIDQIQMGDAGDGQRLLAELGSAMQQVQKATEIISHLRTFGRAAPMNQETLFINEVVERALALMHEQLRDRDVEVRLDLCRDNPVIMGNAIQLEQVFINVLSNARDALTDCPEKIIFVSCQVQGGIVEVVFRDTGPGIPAGLEERIFDPFFTTKEVGRGTGLGLSIAYGIIKEHQGTISLINRPGQGAAFLIQLPLVRGREGDGNR